MITVVAIAPRRGDEMTKALIHEDAMSDLVPTDKFIEKGRAQDHVVLIGSGNNEDNLVTR